MLVESVPATVLATNCWVVAPADGEDCVVIDPGGGLHDRLARLLDAHRLAPVAVLVTHGHFDHTLSAAGLSDDCRAPVHIHAADRWQLADPWAGIGLPPGTPVPGLRDVLGRVPADVREVADGDELRLAGLVVRVTAVPGHTPGSVVYSVESDGGRQMFTGDFLFAGSIGRMDLPGGDEEQMLESLRETVLTAPADAAVHPGHGPSSTIGRELATNSYLRQLRALR